MGTLVLVRSLCVCLNSSRSTFCLFHGTQAGPARCSRVQTCGCQEWKRRILRGSRGIFMHLTFKANPTFPRLFSRDALGSNSWALCSVPSLRYFSEVDTHPRVSQSSCLRRRGVKTMARESTWWRTEGPVDHEFGGSVVTLA